MRMSWKIIGGHDRKIKNAAGTSKTLLRTCRMFPGNYENIPGRQKNILDKYRKLLVTYHTGK